ncbi:Serine/threonine-protein kinase atr-like protein [Dinothrombium tinctorium]|uniref:Serine/threonine-protein kinase atr-like protein n=1 Tax=Dinothrombium tinctorium TaxID=1965070 RepID=A0A443RRX3_9ACAR|nr:Serine/threonine-protein kinase atr-like protein [Dinothrombium tinctorium]
MIDAMGARGYEGPFRKTCEATVRVMRDKSVALMSVLRVLEWKTTDRITAEEAR